MQVMATVQRDSELQAPEKPQLWSVWIDTNCGLSAKPDWWENSRPQALASALQEAQESRALGFPAQILPEGEKPSPDALRYDDPYPR